jgi:hypothetical protein
MVRPMKFTNVLVYDRYPEKYVTLSTGPVHGASGAPGSRVTMRKISKKKRVV